MQHYIYHFKIVKNGPTVRYMLVRENTQLPRTRIENCQYHFNTEIVQDILVPVSKNSMNTSIKIINNFRKYVRDLAE